MELKRFDNFINEKLHGPNSSRPSIDLRGESGNAYVILGMAQNLTKQLVKADPERYDWTKIQSEMMSGDYKNLVNTFEEYFGDYVDIYNADVIDESVNEAVGDKDNIKFASQKAKVLDKVDELMDAYDDLTVLVSPKHWRTTGSNFTEMKKIKEDVKTFSEATEKDKENKYYKEELHRYIKKKKDL